MNKPNYISLVMLGMFIAGGVIAFLGLSELSAERRFEKLYKESLQRNNIIINWCNAKNEWFDTNQQNP